MTLKNVNLHSYWILFKHAVLFKHLCLGCESWYYEEGDGLMGWELVCSNEDTASVCCFQIESWAEKRMLLTNASSISLTTIVNRLRGISYPNNIHILQNYLSSHVSNKLDLIKIEPEIIMNNCGQQVRGRIHPWQDASPSQFYK